VKAFVTGAAGFVGGSLVRQLVERGDSVVAVVRDPARSGGLAAIGCELIGVDLANAESAALQAAMEGADAVFHLAGNYRVGIPRRDRPALYAANVSATERVIEASIAAGTPRIVYVSTANVFGNTHGRVVDESYRRPLPARYLSYYDETKHLGHVFVEEQIQRGAAVTIAMPGMVYGPGDHSQVGGQIAQTMAGRLPVLAAPDLGGNLVHVDDVAKGLLLIHDRGRIGASYLLGGTIATLREVIGRAATLAGRHPPRLTVPSWLPRAIAPVGELISRVAAGAPDFGELVRASAGVTYWFTDARARTELGYAPVDLDAGLRTLLPGG
jgi:dihydroflavonol-4-reductase